MKKLLLPLLLIVCGCSNFDYDSGWMDWDSDHAADVFRNKLTKSDMEYINSPAGIRSTYREYVSGDELSEKWEVPSSLRQQSNKICRIHIKKGVKLLISAEFYIRRWTVESLIVPKD